MREIYIKEEALPIINNIKDCIGDKIQNYEEITRCMFEKYKGTKNFTSYLRYSANSCDVKEENFRVFNSHIMGLLVMMDDAGILDSRWGKDNGKREYWVK